MVIISLIVTMVSLGAVPAATRRPAARGGGVGACLLQNLAIRVADTHEYE